MASNIKKRINLFDDEEVRVIEDENGNKVNNSIDITPFNRNSLGGFYNQNLIIPKRSGVNEDILNQSIRMTLASSNKEEEKKWYEDFFQRAKSFDDGYQFGDVSKTVGGSLLDIVGGIGKGIVSTGENIGDFLSSTVVAGGADLLGKHDYAQQVRENVANKKGHVFSNGIENMQNATDKYSVIGNTSDNINESIGYMASIWATSEIGGGFLGNATIFTSSAGKSVSDSYAKYGTDLDKMAPIWEKAIADGAIETFTENMFGMFGKVDAKVPNIVSGKIKSGLGKMLARTGLSSVGEAAEEFISYGLGAITDRVIDTVNKGSDIKFAEKWDWNQIIEQSVTAALTTIMMGGMGDTKAIIDTKTNNPGLSNTQAINQVARMKDAQSIREDIEDLEAKRKKEGKYSEQGKEIQNEINEKQKQLDQMLSARNFMTDNEQKVYDNIYNTRMTDIQRSKTIDELTKQTQDTLEKSYGRKLTEQEIEDIRKDVENSVDNNTFDINRTELNDEEKAKIEKDIMDDFRNGNIDINTVRSALGENIDISKDRLLTSSLYENSQKYADYTPEFTGNEKIDKLLQSAVDAGMNNTSRTRKMIKTVSTLVENTDRQYRFVNNEQLESDGYNSSANGLIDKKTGEILINVNSTKTLEAVVGHETTHLFDSKVKGKYTQEYKDLQKAVKEFLQDNGTYESKVKEITDTYLKAGYNLTADEVMEEVVADTIGDYLFGEDADAFIAKLSENKTVFQKIYDYIKRLVNKLRGNDIDITPYENLENKFKEVWKTLNTAKDIDTKTKYSIAGKQGMNNAIKQNTANLVIEQSYKKAIQLSENGIDNETIRKTTNWFKDKNGDWKFEFSDKDMTLKNIQIDKNKTYKLEEILRHDILFEIYPELKKLEITFKNMKNTNGSFNRNTQKIKLNKKLIGNDTAITGTLIHEIQHAIQKIEGFEGGKSSKVSKLAYYQSLGEIEADDTKRRFLGEKYGNLDTNKIPPKSSQTNPKHSQLNSYLQNRGLIDKIKDGIYNYFNIKKLGRINNENNYRENYEIDEKSKGKYSGLVVGRENLDNDTKYSISQDSQGRTLSKEQQEYFKNSKAVNSKGELETVYHGSNKAGFTEFNRNYNYYTNNKEVAQSYTHGTEMVDTKRLESVSDAKSWLKGINNEIYINKNSVYDYDGQEILKYNSEEELLKNLKRDIQKEFGNTEAGGTYEGYINISKPIMVDAKGDIWSMIGIDGISINGIDDVEKFLKEHGSSVWKEKGKLRTTPNDIAEAVMDAIEEGEIDTDGIIIKNVYDEGGYGNITPTESGTDYITFNSNQFKAADNKTPTDNPDIRYSISDSQQDRISKLNEEFELTDKTRDQLYDERNNLQTQYDDIVNSEAYKAAVKKVVKMTDIQSVTKTEEYKLMLQAQNLKKQINDIQDEIDIATSEMRRLSEAIDNEEKQHRNPGDSIKQAIKKLGLTDNFNEAGYMLEDGKLLDFSGRSQGSNAYNQRTMDHREINEFGYDMNEFIALGNIRMQPEGNGFELMKEPTVKQYTKLKEYIERANGEIFIDVYKNNRMGLYDSAEYKKGTPTNKIISDLHYYFKNGTFPQQSELAQFRYSLTQGEADQYWKKLDKNNAKEYNTIESEVGNYGNEQVSTENDRLQENENQQTNAADEERYERVKDLYRDYKKGVGEERARLNDSVVNILSELPISKTKAQQFIRELANNKVMTQQDIQTFLENNNKFKDKEVNEYFQQIRNDINSYSFALDDTIRAELKSKYGNIPRNIKFSNNGMSIDTIYQELSNEYPDIFSPEIKNASDEAIEIIDFMRDNPIVTITEGDVFTPEELTEKVTEIYAYKQVYEEAKNYYEQRFLDDKRTLSARNILENKTPLKITRKMVKEQIIQDMGITVEELEQGNDISSLNYQITDPIRVNEKVYGQELGRKINDLTINQTKHNTAEKTRWLKNERKGIKALGIKARSKESAAVQKYGEKQYVNNNGEVVKYGDAELSREFPNIQTQEKIKHAAEVIRNKYDNYIEQINNVITALGYTEIPKRTDYMRHFQELGDIFSQTGVPFNLNDMKAEDLPTDINGLTEFNKPGKNWFAQAQKRYGNKTTYDAITGIDGYLEGAGNLIFHTQDIQNYRALSSMIRDTFGAQKGFEKLGNLSDEQALQRIEEIQNNKLSRYVAWLDEQANNLAGKKGAIDRGVERVLGRRGFTFFNTIKKQVGSNMTGFNVRSSLTNLISSTIAAAKINKIALVKGTASTINNMFHNDEYINKSDFLTSRFGSDQLSTKLWQKISNAGQIFMNGTDYFTANLINRSKYYEGLQKGMTETEAIKYADDFAARVMGDRSQGATAEAFNSKTLGLFTQFQLEVNNQWQYMIHDTKMDYQTNSKINGGLKAGATMLFQMGQLAAFSYFFNEIFEKLTGSRAAFDPIEIFKKLFGLDDEDDEEKSFDQRLAEANSLLIDNIPFGNLITGGGRIPISEAFTGINTLSKKITGQKDKYGNEITWENVKQDTLGTLPYWILPSGYGQIKKTSQGLDMYNNKVPGSYTDSGNLRYTVDEDAKSKIQAAIFGAWANPYAQDYIDSGYKTINKNNIDEMVGLGMNSTEYREFKQGMTDVGDKKQDKLNYINGSDLTTEQKNLVANNLDKNSKSKIDMQEYDNYNSYDEYKYARDNPSKYLVITQIDTFDKYNTYKSTISSIKEEYSSSAGYTTAQRKVAVQNYIESLDLSVPQKMMLEYMAGGYSIKGYSNYIQEYLDSTQLTTQEKYDIWEELFN